MAGVNADLTVAFMLYLCMQEGQVIECSQVSDVRVGAAPKVLMSSVFSVEYTVCKNI